MKFDIVTIFPKIFDSWINASIIKRAIDSGIIDIHTHDIRDFTTDVHRSVDDTPYGSGAGMVMRPEPLVSCVESISKKTKTCRILLTPQGKPFKQKTARDLSELDQIVLICGRYEGVDERAREIVVDKELSVGDYITAGGEIPAIIVMEAISRLIPGVLGNKESLESESFEKGLLEYPQYTRPEVFRKQRVPEVLLSGHHLEISKWRRKEALIRTYKRRPELIENIDLSEEEQKLLEKIKE